MADPLLQQGPQHRIGPGNPPLQIAGREDNGGAFLIEPDRRPEMAPIRLVIRRSRPGQQNLGRAPVRSAQGADGIDGNGERSVRDLVRALGLGLVDREGEQGHVAADRQRRDGAPVLDAQVRHQRPHGIAQGLGMLHQAPDHAERQDRGALADQQPEMRTVRAGHAQGEQPAQGRMRDDVRSRRRTGAGRAPPPG